MFASLFGSSSNHYKKEYKIGNSFGENSTASETNQDEFIVVEKTEIPEVSPAPLLTEVSIKI